ncbi:MAG: RNA ligase family protein [Armatimonadetes bacterium]|nr:RNA ligase family protein [Armatimonadota bacterium]
MYEKEKLLLPEFPRTMHLPIEPNAHSDDKVASVGELRALLKEPLAVQEKLCGANCGVALFEGQPIVRNRNHILNKAYPKRNTPAKEQFSSIWTWLYEHVDNLARLNKLADDTVGVYGEWLFAENVISYDRLPDWFVAYDVYVPHTSKFMPPDQATDLLQEAGFSVVPILATGVFTPEALLELRDGPSEFSTTSPREGIFIKAAQANWDAMRYKMVAPWFKTDEDWNKKALVKNKLAKKARV